MSIWDGQTVYYSGQGTVLIGSRTSLGAPRGLIPVGNCSGVVISSNESLIEHKESQTGQRSVDKVLTTQLKPAISIDMESVNARNLALALRGDRTNSLGKASTGLTGETNNAYFGKVSVLKFMKLTGTPVVKRAATTLTAYTNDATPFDYKINMDGGSIWFNDGSVQPVASITTGGTAPSAITVSAGEGQDTTVTVAVPASVQVGDYVVFTGFAGADAALINGIPLEITSIAAGLTSLTVRKDTFGKTITLGTPLSCFDGQAITVDYKYQGQQIVQAFTQAAAERWVRFEGVNTADSNNPLVVDCFKMRISPMKQIPLIGDDIGKLTLEGDLLQDVLQTSGSQYFREVLMNP